MQKPTVTTSAAVAAAVAGALGGYVAVEAVQPLSESRTCSNIGTTLCPPGSVPQSDVNDREFEGPAAERNPTQQAPPPGFPNLVAGTGHFAMQGGAADLLRDVFDSTGMSASTPLPLRLAPPTIDSEG